MICFRRDRSTRSATMDGTIISCAGAENNDVSTVFHGFVIFMLLSMYVSDRYLIHRVSGSYDVV